MHVEFPKSWWKVVGCKALNNFQGHIDWVILTRMLIQMIDGSCLLKWLWLVNMAGTELYCWCRMVLICATCSRSSIIKSWMRVQNIFTCYRGGEILCGMWRKQRMPRLLSNIVLWFCQSDLLSRWGCYVRRCELLLCKEIDLVTWWIEACDILLTFCVGIVAKWNCTVCTVWVVPSDVTRFQTALVHFTI